MAGEQSSQTGSTSYARTHYADELLAGDVLMTGFPGFIAGNLVRELLKRQPTVNITFLVLPQMRGVAETRLAELEHEFEQFEGRWSVITGDITDRFLGLGESAYAELTSRINVVWHLAAIYDLAVSEAVAYRVNVTGTVHMLDFCEACDDLRRFNYISTAYVAGERVGTIYEDELDEGQSHKNAYEATKFWAEVEVQRRWKDIPTAIFRPCIVVGDSRSGETDKYDGPYFVLMALQKLPSWMPAVNVGTGEAIVNMVPVNFATAAMAHISLKADTDHHVYHIADPHPMRARDIVALILDCMDRPPAIMSVPSGVAQRLVHSRKVERWLGLPEEVVDYFDHDANFDSSNAQRALHDSTIRCPHLSSYMQTLVDYFLRHPEKIARTAEG